jgi:hypothetical protein
MIRGGNVTDIYDLKQAQQQIMLLGTIPLLFPAGRNILDRVIGTFKNLALGRTISNVGKEISENINKGKRDGSNSDSQQGEDPTLKPNIPISTVPKVVVPEDNIPMPKEIVPPVTVTVPDISRLIDDYNRIIREFELKDSNTVNDINNLKRALKRTEDIVASQSSEIKRLYSQILNYTNQLDAYLKQSRSGGGGSTGRRGLVPAHCTILLDAFKLGKIRVDDIPQECIQLINNNTMASGIGDPDVRGPENDYPTLI